MDYSYELKYHELEKQHFWFKARRHLIKQLLINENKSSTILDIGCSSGMLLLDLIEMGFDSNQLFGIDISESAIANCHRNQLNQTYVMNAENIELNQQFDMVIASDCLEHLEYDEVALRNWHALLNKGGKIFIFVPAYQMLWSDHDVDNHHYRRYTRKELNDKLLNAGFQIKKSSYWNTILFPPILGIRKLKNFRPSLNRKNGETADLNRIPPLNDFWNALLILENNMIKKINFPFGVSVFTIAEK